MNLYDTFVPQASQMLDNLQRWLSKAEEQAQAAGYDSAVLLSARLFPDQYPLVKQVQIASDSAKLTAARVCGKPAPKHEDTETSLESLRDRIASIREFLGTLQRADFEGADARIIQLPFDPGNSMRADEYVIQFALPNLYFHLSTAYAILRHNAVPLGKRTFIGRLTLTSDS